MNKKNTPWVTKVPVVEETSIYHLDSLIIVINRTLTTLSIAINFSQFFWYLFKWCLISF